MTHEDFEKAVYYWDNKEHMLLSKRFRWTL